MKLANHAQLELIPAPRELTLAEARDIFWQQVDAGSHCPCCEKWGKQYPRTLNSTMAYALIWMVRRFELNGGDWIDMPREAPRFIVESNQHSTMKHWRLVEPQPSDDPRLKCSGIWRPTPTGIEFAYNRITVPKKIYEFAGKLTVVGEERINCAAALTNRFNYEELIGHAE